MRRAMLPRPPRARRILPLALAGLVLASASCLIGAHDPSGGAARARTPETPPPPPAPALSAVARIGATMFHDPHLSASGQLSCAACHDPANHYAPSNARAVQIGGAKMNLPGLRAVPTLTYKALTPPFTMGPENPALEANEASPQQIAAEGDKAKGVATVDPARVPAPQKSAGKSTLNAPVPRGGMFWDGRVDTFQEQALAVLFTHFEMAEPSRAALAKVLRARYGAALAKIFGDGILGDRRMLIAESAFAISRYQTELRDFHPYSSKYDAYLAGRATLTPAEARGLKLFDDPQKGNCAACHLDKPGKDGRPPQFTDYEYEALGVPRNPRIPANADPKFFDLGLCGPLRNDNVAQQPANCGLFKTPTLRNVATRHVFFHNGVYTSLKQVLDFYAKRDSDPAAIYPVKDGKLQRFDDLPTRYRGNVDHIDAPFGRHPGQGPALTEAEEADIIAFLHTLTDGYQAGD